MKTFFLLSVIVSLLHPVTIITNDAIQYSTKDNPASAGYVTLEGTPVLKGNPVEADGNIHNFSSPLLHLIRTASKSPKGTILVIPGGDYKILKVGYLNEKVTGFLNSEGFDIAILEYSIASKNDTRVLAVADANKAFMLLKKKSDIFGLHNGRMCILGFSSGGQLAAKTIQGLSDMEQPDDLILVSPTLLNETITGTVYPAVKPPLKLSARLLAITSAQEESDNIRSCQEYSKTWVGFDGQSSFILMPDSTYLEDTGMNPADSTNKLSTILGIFLKSKPATKPVIQNPATIPVQGYNSKRHFEKLELVRTHKFDLIMIGNSITNNFEKPEYQSVWNQFFGSRNALNLGFSAYRTENIIWNIQNGELDTQSPKVVVLEIGTNNIDEKNFPTRHTAGQLVGGIEAIVKLLREKLPDSKIVVLRCFPGCYGGPNPTSHRAILERASDIVSRLADGKYIFYCDVNHVFLNSDGSINQEMMPDWLHPSVSGAKAWAKAMEPLLSKLMGDKLRDTNK